MNQKTPVVKHTMRELIKQRQGIYDDFYRLNPDARLTLHSSGVSELTGWCNVRVKFCSKKYFKPVIALEEKPELAIDLIYFAHYMNNSRYSNQFLLGMPSYELRIDTTKDKPWATLRLNGEWKRIPFKLARVMLEYQGLEIAESNREAYISNIAYTDWFRFKWNHEHYEGLLEDYEIPEYVDGVLE